jgi:predicted transcriptional regulator
MAMTTPPRRASLHALVDALPERDLADAEQLLQSFAQADPALRAALLAPVDDEPLRTAEIASIEQAHAEIARGEYVTDDELDILLAPRDT